MEHRKYLSVKEIAEHLGVSEKTVRAAVRSGRLPAIRIGRLIRIAEGDEAKLAYAAPNEHSANGHLVRRVERRPSSGKYGRSARAS